MFASLIEKCYAKFYGGYHAIHKLGLEVNINLVNPIWLYGYKPLDYKNDWKNGSFIIINIYHLIMGK